MLSIFKGLFRRKVLWVRTYDIVGHRPTFRMTCKMCRPWWKPKRKMVLRNSKLMIVKIEEEVKIPIRCHVNRMNYKCPECDWVTAFLVPDKTEYIETLVEKRGGALYYPGIEEWSKDKVIKEKLAALGYF